MIKKFWNWFKSLFESKPSIKVQFFAHSISMAKSEFAKMRKFFEGNLEVEIERISDESFDLWKLVLAMDEYGNRIKAVEQVGYYNGETETFYSTHSFDTLYQIYSDNA